MFEERGSRSISEENARFLQLLDRDPEELNSVELALYIRGWLRGYDQPLSRVPPERLLKTIYIASRNEQFKARFRAVVADQLIAWQPSSSLKEVNYARGLIILIGAIEAEDGCDALAKLAKDPQMAMVKGDVDLPDLALATMLTFPSECRRPGFWEPLFEDSKYFDTAFLAFIQRNPEEALSKLGEYLRKAKNSGYTKGVVVSRVHRLYNDYCDVEDLELQSDRAFSFSRIVASLPSDLQEYINPANSSGQEI